MSPAELLHVLTQAAARYVDAGGVFMLPLVGCTVALWYAIGHRAHLLRRGTRLDARALLAAVRERRALDGRGVRVTAAVEVARTLGTPGDPARQLDAALEQHAGRLDRGAVLARTIVSVAPMLGLLGTVSGMIEMFDSLGTGTFHAQEGGIAGGIAEALFTTQLGLGVAIPGYFATRLLDHRAARLRAELDELRDVALQAAAGSTIERTA